MAITDDCNCPPDRCFAEELNDIGQGSAAVCPKVQMIPIEADADAMHAPAIIPYRIRYGQGMHELLEMRRHLRGLDDAMALVRRCLEDCNLARAAEFLALAIRHQANAIGWASR